MTMNQALLDRVLASPRLPSLPAVALQVLELTGKKDIDVKQIAKTIGNDPALSSKIIRTVNSGYYGVSQQVSTIHHAIMMLGLNAVKTLALGFSLINNVKTSTTGLKFDMMMFWRRSLYGAITARSIAQHCRMGQVEEVFLAALLRDLGMIALMEVIGRDYIDLVTGSDDLNEALLKREQQALGLTHPEIGAQMAERWQFPEMLSACIRYHVESEKAPEAFRHPARALRIGDCVAEIFIEQTNTYALQDYFRYTRRWFKLDNKSSEKLIREIGMGARELSKLFEIKTGPENDPELILSQANEALAAIAFESAQSATQLKQENKVLQEKATLDGLTGIANRAKLNEYLEQQIAMSHDTNTPVSLIFIDADKFKSINDTYGHLAGDEVLKALARLLKDHTPESGLIGRYGGEEFAMVLPGVDRIPAARLADSLRKRIAAMQIQADDNLVLTVTCSMGVSTAMGGKYFKNYYQLIEAADRAVYAAKASGRNCVRIFSPKPRR